MRADQVTALYRNAPTGMWATMLAGVVLEQFLLPIRGVSAPAMHIWLAVLVAQTIARLALCEVHRRAGPPVPAVACQLQRHARSPGAVPPRTFQRRGAAAVG